MSILKEKYNKEIRSALKEELGLGNIMQVPTLTKIVMNIGMGEATQNQRLVDEALETLTLITGQKAIPTKAKTAISNFKLREGINIGAKVTLSGDRMWEFLTRFVNITLPRVRDFRGIPKKGFDGRGNYTMGLKDQSVFIEIDYERIKRQIGMDISFVTSAVNDEQGRALLSSLGLPFRK